MSLALSWAWDRRPQTSPEPTSHCAWLPTNVRRTMHILEQCSLRGLSLSPFWEASCQECQVCLVHIYLMRARIRHISCLCCVWVPWSPCIICMSVCRTRNKMKKTKKEAELYCLSELTTMNRRHIMTIVNVYWRQLLMHLSRRPLYHA